MPSRSKSEAGTAKRTASRARNEPAPAPATAAPDPGRTDWEQVRGRLARFVKLYERWSTKDIDGEAYLREVGCSPGCEEPHTGNAGEHYPGTHGTPVLLVTYSGANGVNHRRHDGSRAMPYYIFTAGQGPVRITDPFDKFAYISRALTNPEVWAVAFEGVN